jgi:hypothetical protein
VVLLASLEVSVDRLVLTLAFVDRRRNSLRLNNEGAMVGAISLSWCSRIRI